MAFGAFINYYSTSLAMDTPSIAFNSIYTVAMFVVLGAWPLIVTVRFSLAIKDFPMVQKSSIFSIGGDLHEGGERDDPRLIQAKTKQGRKGSFKKKKKKRVVAKVKQNHLNRITLVLAKTTQMII